MRFLSDDRKVDPNGAKMRVLALGLSRCATTSLQAALESDVIGLAPCMHMAHVGPHADKGQMVLDAIREPEGSARRQKLLHRVFDGYRATADFPGWHFAADLMDMYPDASVVLNQRKNAHVWAESFRNSLRFFGTLPYLAMCFLWKTDRLHYAIHKAAYAAAERKFGIKDIFTPEFYDIHNNWVRAEASKRGRRVLEWEVGDGWGPLCEFLGKHPPEDGRAFPRLNDAAALNTVKRILVARGLLSWAALGAAAWASWSYGPGFIEKIIKAATKSII